MRQRFNDKKITDERQLERLCGWLGHQCIRYKLRRACFQALSNTVNITDLRILDFGSGSGVLSEKMAPLASSIVALDPADKMIAVLNGKQLNNVTTIAQALSPELIAKTPALNEKFDLIVASSALAFVEDYQQTVSLLKQLLKPQGRLIQWDWLLESSGEGSGFTVDEIQQAYRQAGFARCATSLPFAIKDNGNKMQVVMAVGQI